MDWLIALVTAGVVVYFVISRKKSTTVMQEKPSACRQADFVTDDFVGNSVSTFFLLEEFVDNNQHELKKNEGPIFEEDVLFFDADIGDEFFEDEYFS